MNENYRVKKRNYIRRERAQAREETVAAICVLENKLIDTQYKDTGE
jgi:hypothetical protein